MKLIYCTRMLQRAVEHTNQTGTSSMGGEQGPLSFREAVEGITSFLSFEHLQEAGNYSRLHRGIVYYYGYHNGCILVSFYVVPYLGGNYQTNLFEIDYTPPEASELSSVELATLTMH